jgi:hypothetical protein
MSNISMRVNMGDFVSTMQHLTQSIAQKVDNRTQQAAINVQGQATRDCPVGTPESTHKKDYEGGTLKKGNYAHNTGFCHSEAGNDVPYAGFVDGGHHTRSGSFVPANPFFTNAALLEEQAYIRDCQDML